MNHIQVSDSEAAAVVKTLMDNMQHMDDEVNHPSHYTMGGMETIEFIEAKQLGFHLGNVVKYVTRAGHKGEPEKDLAKAHWYLNRYMMLPRRMPPTAEQMAYRIAVAIGEHADPCSYSHADVEHIVLGVLKAAEVACR